MVDATLLHSGLQAAEDDGQWTRFKFDEDQALDGEGAGALDPAELPTQAGLQSRNDRSHEASLALYVIVSNYLSSA